MVLKQEGNRGEGKVTNGDSEGLGFDGKCKVKVVVVVARLKAGRGGE